MCMFCYCFETFAFSDSWVAFQWIVVHHYTVYILYIYTNARQEFNITCSHKAHFWLKVSDSTLCVGWGGGICLCIYIYVIERVCICDSIWISRLKQIQRGGGGLRAGKGLVRRTVCSERWLTADILLRTVLARKRLCNFCVWASLFK